MILTGVMVALYLVGLVAGIYFVVGWTRRVTHPMSSAALDASGWVYAMVALLAFGLLVLAAAGPPVGLPRQINSVVFLAAFDWLLCNRALRWRRHLRSTEGDVLHLVDGGA